MKTILSALGLSLLIFTSCGGQKKVEVDFIQDNIDNAVAQNTIQTDIIEKSGKILNPRTINKDGSISYIPIDDWCSGFFPGSIDRKSTRLNSSHSRKSRMPSSA